MDFHSPRRYKEIPHFESSHEIQLLNNYVHTWSWPGLHFLYQHALLLTSHKLTVTQTDQLLTQKQLLELTASSLQQCREISHPQGCQIIHLSSCSSSSCTSQGSSARLFEFSSSVMLLCCPSHCIFILRHQKITVLCPLSHKTAPLWERGQLACHSVRYLIYYSVAANWFHEWWNNWKRSRTCGFCFDFKSDVCFLIFPPSRPYLHWLTVGIIYFPNKLY